MKQHLGEVLEKAIRQSGYPITKIAKQIGYTRQHMYNLFHQQKIDLRLFDEIGKIIHVDFSENIKQYRKFNTFHSESESTILASENIYKEKYLSLLEEHKELLKEYNKLLKNKV